MAWISRQKYILILLHLLLWNPAIFDDGWKEKLGMTYSDIQWEATGERLTEETFNTYRKQGGVVIMHMMKPEWIAKRYTKSCNLYWI